MFVLVTVEALYYEGLLLTFDSYQAAFQYAGKLDGWYDIEGPL